MGVVPSRGSARGEGGRFLQFSPFSCLWCFSWLLLFFTTCIATAQTNPPPVTCVRSFTNDVPNQPLVSVSLYGASNVTCLTYEESLPAGVSAQNVSGDGKWLPGLNAVRWGPYTNTTSLSLSYRLAGWPGSYPVNGGSWMDGQWYFSPGLTMVTVGGSYTLTPPPQAAIPVFTPGSGANVPANVAISCATPGAVIYYTLDGTLPTQSSMLYTGAVSLASASVIRAVAFTNGWAPSVAGFANYGPSAAVANAQVTRSISSSSPAAPVVSFNVLPGTNSICVAVMETLPQGVGAVNVSAGGNYIASNNMVLWGPFIGSNVLSLSYQATGQPGVYPIKAFWSVDGVGGSEAMGTNLVISGSVVPTGDLLSSFALLSHHQPARGRHKHDRDQTVLLSLSAASSRPSNANWRRASGSGHKD